MDSRIPGLFVLLMTGVFCQVCQRRGNRPCGTNSFYCYEEFTESWRCLCELGYENNDPNRGEAFNCADINECLIHHHNCGENTWCRNLNGGFQCLCESGFTNLQLISGTSVCSDINECEQTPRCPENSVCTNTPGSYNCTCAQGYSQGNGFCYDLNECEAEGGSTCGVGAVCINTLGSFTCLCPDGSTNRTCESPRVITGNLTPDGGVDQDRYGAGAVDISQNNAGNDGNVNQTDSRLKEMEPQNTSVFIGVGVGMALVLMGCVFAVAYVLFARKRSREHRDRARQRDTSPLQTSSASVVSAQQANDVNAKPNTKHNHSEHQYFTLSPDPTSGQHQKNPDEITAMYSNHKIEKKKSGTAESSLDPAGDPPIVYQIFGGAAGGKDKTGKGSGVVKIQKADPKSMAKPAPRQLSTEQLNYATIFENTKAGGKGKKLKSSENPYSEVSEKSPPGGTDKATGRKLIKISSPGNSSHTYDHLERLRLKAKAPGEYDNLYGDSNHKSRNRQADRKAASSQDRKPALIPYEVVQVIPDS